jgi:hypothetical protein
MTIDDDEITERGTPPADEARSARDLLREALEETRELIRLEVAIARRELKEELAQAKTSAVGFGIAGVSATLGVAMLLVAIVTAFRLEWLVALVIGALLLVLAGSTALAAYRAMPRKPLEEARERIESDMRVLKERMT